MNLNEFNKVLVIVSTKARNYKTIYNLLSDKLINILDRNKYEIKLTQDKDSVTKFSTDFSSKYNYSLIIIAGGDGSLNETVNAIGFNSSISILLIPSGTGNDFARYIYNNNSYEYIINKLDNVDIDKVDLLKINDKLYVNIFSFGYDSIVLAKSLEIKEKFPILSKFSFILGIIFTLNKIKSYKYELNLNLDRKENIVLNKNLILTAICNGRFYGGGFNPAPFALLNDGVIDINTIDYLNAFKLIKLLRLYKNESHVNNPVSNSYKVISGKITSKDNSIIIGEIDGNLYNCNEVEFSIIPNSLNLCTIK